MKMKSNFLRLPNTIAVIAVVILMVCFSLSVHADNVPPAPAQAEQIDAYSTSIAVSANAELNVSEIIEYDFGPNQRHGIYRDIPLKASNGDKLHISNISVDDENTNAQEFTTSTTGGELDIKIGDPNVLLSGVHTYSLRFTVNGAISFDKSGGAQLNWNVVGDQWTVPISNISVSVKTPKSSTASSAQLTTACFVGVYGSTQQCDSAGMDPNDANNLLFSETSLQPNTDITINISFPSGVILPPSASQKFTQFLQNNWPFALPVIAFFTLLFLWLTKGRDPKGSSVIVAEYAPPDNLAPALLGTIVTQHTTQKMLTAEIINLAVNGYIRINRVPITAFLGLEHKDDFQLELLKEGDVILLDYQKDLLDNLFLEQYRIETSGPAGNPVIALSKLDMSFAPTAKFIQQKIGKLAIEQGYLHAVPMGIALSTVIIGMLALFFGFTVISSSAQLGISIAFCGFISFFFVWTLGQHTPAGVEMKRRALGLKLYLSVAEKDRLEFANAPAADPKQFEKLLPYAIVFGVEQEWAKKFESIYVQAPSWYNDPTNRAFNTAILISNLNAFNSVTGASMAPARSGGGGGFAGGGGGGGGGGSW